MRALQGLIFHYRHAVVAARPTLHRSVSLTGTSGPRGRPRRLQPRSAARAAPGESRSRSRPRGSRGYRTHGHRPRSQGAAATGAGAGAEGRAEAPARPRGEGRAAAPQVEPLKRPGRRERRAEGGGRSPSRREGALGGRGAAGGDLPQAVAQGPIREKPLSAVCKYPSLGRDHLGAAVAEREGYTELWGAVRPSSGAAGIPGGGRSASEPSGKDARDEMAAGAGGLRPRVGPGTLWKAARAAGRGCCPAQVQQKLLGVVR